MNPTNVTPLHREGEPPMTAAEQRLYWRAYGDGWRDCATDGKAEKEIYDAGFLAGVGVAMATEQAPKRPHLRIVS